MPAVVFRVAAGSRIGFGHVVRCRSIARALGVEPLVSIRGNAATRIAAASIGCSPLQSSSERVLRALNPGLIVIDDPCARAAAVWVRRARKLGCPVASVHDLGLGKVSSDLALDASADPILDPSVASMRDSGKRPCPLRVLIALGGGTHGRGLAALLASAIARRVPEVRIRAAAGFAVTGHQPEIARGHWIEAPEGLAAELASATVAVTAGGVTLFEACALGIPAVALPVVPPQQLTIQAVARTGSALDAGAFPIDRTTILRAADAVADILTNRRLHRRMSDAGRRFVDGRGVFRAVERLRELAGAASHAA